MPNTISYTRSSAVTVDGTQMNRTKLTRRMLAAGAGISVLMAGLSRITSASQMRTAGPACAALRQAHGMGDSLTTTQNWEEFRRRFVMADGRVVDTANRRISHTEGQGLAMLFAVEFDDRETFELVWNWTSHNLSRSYDSLHAWCLVPGNPNPDSNTATDGDIYIGAALLRAAAKWNNHAFQTAGTKIARSILALTVTDVAGRTVLLPGVEGFVKARHVVVNPSYYVFPLLEDLAAAAPSPRWTKLICDGHALIAEARFGKRQLPADWILVSVDDGKVSLAKRWPARFSFDAVRIPLFLAWSGAGAAELQPFIDHWGADPSRVPAWVALDSDDCAPFPPSNGMTAIGMVVTRSLHSNHLPNLPVVSSRDDYYSSALVLLSQMVLRDVTVQV